VCYGQMIARIAHLKCMFQFSCHQFGKPLSS
jgi:hypothetical protein